MQGPKNVGLVFFTKHIFIQKIMDVNLSLTQKILA